ncbi:hypothetical protein, partial [Mesorhizobium sp. A623]
MSSRQADLIAGVFRCHIGARRLLLYRDSSPWNRIFGVVNRLSMVQNRNSVIFLDLDRVEGTLAHPLHKPTRVAWALFQVKSLIQA